MKNYLKPIKNMNTIYYRISSSMPEFSLVPLTKERFERSIAVGSRLREIMTLFNKTQGEMNAWCQENYGANFVTVYDILMQDAAERYVETLKKLGEERGNQTALNIVSQFLVNKSANDKVVKIVFDGSVPEESEDEKADD